MGMRISPKLKQILNIFIVVIFMLSFMYILILSMPKALRPSYRNALLLKEAMSDITPSCPNLLRQEGDMVMLYDLNQPSSDTNPAVFHNLGEYGQFVKEQQAKGIHCPVLELQTQIIGSSISTASIPRTSEINSIKQLDAQFETKLEQIKGYDKYNPETKIGLFTKELDVIDPDAISDNPMDHHWGGIQYSAQTLASGKYDGDMVTKPLYYNMPTNAVRMEPGYHDNQAASPPNYVPRDLLGKDITTTK
jgi:hypothetical protein